MATGDVEAPMTATDARRGPETREVALRAAEPIDGSRESGNAQKAREGERGFE